jgi:anti-sigma B factor antagonist
MPQRAPTIDVTINLHVELHPGAPSIAEISGEIDIASAPWLRDTLLVAIRRHGPTICVDLHGVTFLDCSGINVLLATARRASLEGGWMRVTRPSAQAWRAITLLGLQYELTKDTSDWAGTSARPDWMKAHLKIGAIQKALEHEREAALASEPPAARVEREQAPQPMASSAAWPPDW